MTPQQVLGAIMIVGAVLLVLWSVWPYLGKLWVPKSETVKAVKFHDLLAELLAIAPSEQVKEHLREAGKAAYESKE